jgi:hypothetical protein
MIFNSHTRRKFCACAAVSGGGGGLPHRVNALSTRDVAVLEKMSGGSVKAFL